MEELRSNVMKILKDVNQSWAKRVKEASENDGVIDTLDMPAEFSAYVELLNKHFREAQERLNKKSGRGGGLFGGLK